MGFTANNITGKHNRFQGLIVFPDFGSSRTLNIIVLIITLISVVLVVSYVLSAPVNVDEGWYQAIAKGKQRLGFYTLTPFHDIDLFKGGVVFSSNLNTQLYRLPEFLSVDNVVRIKCLRMLYLSIWFLLFYTLLSSPLFRNSRNERIIIMNLLVTSPIVFWSFAIARPEVLISGIVALLLTLDHRFRTNNGDKTAIRISILAISCIALLLHPNGIVFVGLFVFTTYDSNEKKTFVKNLALSAAVVLAYYLVFIDANLPLYKKQISVLFQSENEEKFIPNSVKLFEYMLSEITERYLQLDSLKNKLASFGLVLAVTVLFTYALGIYAVIKNRDYRGVGIYALAITLFLILLGNKTPQYLIYISPVLFVVAVYHAASSFRITKLLVLPLLLSFWIVIAISIPINTREQREINAIVSLIRSNAASGARIYAPFTLEPYLIDDYDYLTTNQKAKNRFYERYDIHPKDCLVVAEKKDDIWNWCIGRKTAVGSVGRYLVAEFK